LLHYSNNASSSNNSPGSASAMEPCESVANAAASAEGYVSDGLVHNNSRGERKKGTSFKLDYKRLLFCGLENKFRFLICSHHLGSFNFEYQNFNFSRRFCSVLVLSGRCPLQF